MELDIQKYCAELWEKWIEHPSNIDFKELYFDPRIGERGRLLLTNHVSVTTSIRFHFRTDDNLFLTDLFSFVDSKAVQSD